MHNKSGQPWYEAIPYGPLTEDIYERLGLSHFVPGKEAMRIVALQRGITQDDYEAYQRKEWQKLNEDEEELRDRKEFHDV